MFIDVCTSKLEGEQCSLRTLLAFSCLQGSALYKHVVPSGTKSCFYLTVQFTDCQSPYRHCAAVRSSHTYQTS
jgi:hypothetical protein